MTASFLPRIAASDCQTAFGDVHATSSALLSGQRALHLTPTLGRIGGDPVPLSVLGGRSYDETAPASWWPALEAFARRIPGEGWGTARKPIFVTSSNFAVGSLQAFRQTGDRAFLPFSTPFACIGELGTRLGWGGNVTVLSHACVSAHLGVWQASRHLEAGLADEALVFTFDFLSPFVVGGFNALKILNADFPAPYQDRPTGAVALGDGLGYAVLTRDRGDFRLEAQGLHNEMFHFTSNRPDGAGFETALAPVAKAARGRRVWVKGHGTGTLDAGKLEATTLSRLFPGSPLVSWKGGFGHTLGSCGIIELALALEAQRTGRAPGTVGSAPPTFTPDVATTPFDVGACDAVVCASNAFGGAHATLLVSHA